MRFLDLGFAIGFGVLTVLYPIICISKGQFGLDAIVVEIYYGFFTLFFVGVLIKNKFLTEYCAFMESLWIKSLFYVFCASLGFAQLDIWVCWVVGCCFAVGAIVNMIRCCNKEDINDYDQGVDSNKR